MRDARARGRLDVAITPPELFRRRRRGRHFRPGREKGERERERRDADGDVSISRALASRTQRVNTHRARFTVHTYITYIYTHVGR